MDEIQFNFLERVRLKRLAGVLHVTGIRHVQDLADEEDGQARREQVQDEGGGWGQREAEEAGLRGSFFVFDRY